MATTGGMWALLTSCSCSKQDKKSVSNLKTFTVNFLIFRILFFFLFSAKMLVFNAGIHKMLVCFVALCPKSTAMIMAEWSVHLTTLFFLARLNKRLTALTFACNWQQPFLDESAEGRRMTVEIISWSVSAKYGTGLGLNSRSLDLQSDTHLSDTLPIAC